MFNKRLLAIRPLKVILVLILLLAASLLATTLASYVREASLFANGWVGPKYYAFEVESTGSRESIMPGASADYTFTVKNHHNGGVAQVPLKVLIHAAYPKTLLGTGRVVAQLRCGDTLLSSSDSGILECSGMELTADTMDSDSYTLTLTWLDADMTLLSEIAHSTFDPCAISIRVSGYQ